MCHHNGRAGRFAVGLRAAGLLMLIVSHAAPGMGGRLEEARERHDRRIALGEQGSLASPWKLWGQIAPEDREAELARAFARAAPYGKLVQQYLPPPNRRKPMGASKTHAACGGGKAPVLFGKGGEHMVCPMPPERLRRCKSVSFGIRDDPSFDIELASEWGCQGFAGDPSISHPSKLHKLVSFHNVGLQMLRANVEQRKDAEDEWILTTLPSLRSFLRWDYLDIVKLDCEGCEVALARDILVEDSTFLSHVGQISIETHATRSWIDSDEELYYFALMFPLLEDAGFKLIWSSVFGCGKWEKMGCDPRIESEIGMPCGYDPNSRPNVPTGWSCHDWLWSRV